METEKCDASDFVNFSAGYTQVLTDRLTVLQSYK